MPRDHPSSMNKMTLLESQVSTTTTTTAAARRRRGVGKEKEGSPLFNGQDDFARVTG